MNAMLVGADRLGRIPDLLAEYGIRIASHVTGRDPSSQRAERAVSAGIDIMILFTDFVGHNVMRGYRDVAKRQGTRFLACRRSVCSLRSALEAIPCAGCRTHGENQRMSQGGGRS